MQFKSPTKPSPAHSFDLEKQELSPSPAKKAQQKTKKKTPTDYKSLARIRLFWIIGLVIVILGLLAVISYLEIAKPVMEYHERHG